MNKFEYKIFYTDATLMYGICCFDESGCRVSVIDDITENRFVAEDFCQMLNSEKIYPCHFYDVYEDYFG